MCKVKIRFHKKYYNNKIDPIKVSLLMFTLLYIRFTGFWDVGTTCASYTPCWWSVKLQPLSPAIQIYNLYQLMAFVCFLTVPNLHTSWQGVRKLLYKIYISTSPLIFYSLLKSFFILLKSKINPSTFGMSYFHLFEMRQIFPLISE